MIRLGVLDDYQRVALRSADWASLGVDVEVFSDHLVEEEALVTRLAPFDALVVMRERTPFPRRLLERLPRLRLLVTTGMGNAAVDMAAARERGIDVCGTVLDDRQTIELTWALIMAVVRDIPGEDAAVRRGEWQVSLGRELHGRTLGIVGYGTIGAEVARAARFFGMRVVAWARRLEPGSSPAEGVEAVDFDAVFAEADVVSLHLRLVEATRGMVGARQLELLGPDGFLVNTARGPIVQEEALVAALRGGTIAGAALDVFDVEPLTAGHPLLSTPRTILSPHQGFVAEAAYRASYGEAVEDVRAWLGGAVVRLLNP